MITNRVNGVTATSKINFYLDLLNGIPFLMVIVTGMLLQINYHLHGLPDDYMTVGLSRSGWSLLHKTSAVISLAGIAAHCILHRASIAASTRKFFSGGSPLTVISSFYVLLICVPTALTAMISWIALNPGPAGRSALVEVHDKLALALVAISAYHILTRAG